MNSSKGFTLIEMLVVISIVIIFPAIVISNFAGIKLQFALSRTSHQFAQDLRRVQDTAVSSVPYKDSFGVQQSVDGYGMYVDLTGQGNKKYILYADKKPGNKQYDATDYIVETVDFGVSEPGVIIKQIDGVFGDNVSINFTPPNPDTTITQLNEGGSTVDVIFSLESDLEITKTVSVNTSGLVEIK